MLAVNRQADATAFLSRAERWLLEKEVEHNIFLSVAYLLTGEHHFADPIFLATVEQAGRVRGCALRPPPDGLYLSDMPLDAIPGIHRLLQADHKAIDEVVGPEEQATAFAELWKPQEWKVHSRSRWFSLERIAWNRTMASGRLRNAAENDLPLLREWGLRYGREIGTVVDVKMLYELMVKRGLAYVWDDNGPKCVITASGLTPRAARISSLYTPEEYRGKRYATSAVVLCDPQYLGQRQTALCR